ncbi:hypothetical protein TCON_1772 [Astathelohania contejeani]|uniref:Uncharacterized protein n=1 Tax=Astathelohania contejeani TaxID=164912 RepID=A0ABQ7HY24_9MICR|nr:hypothetical protein TCON_1772 [Thelohania contejeani]
MQKRKIHKNRACDKWSEPVIAVSKTSPPNQVITSSRINVSRYIFDSIDYALEEWLRDHSKAVRTRLSRMPRGGWKMARDFFCKKFSCEVSEEEFKRQAHTIKRDSLESDYSQTKKKDQIIKFFITYFYN